MPQEGQKAPAFKLPNQDGKAVSLDDFKGRSPVVLYFYPKDDTPGCTVEACGLRDAYPKIQKKAVILGVSPDSPSSHMKFREKHGLPFDLLADEEKAAAKAYGVWVKKSLYGKEYMGVARTTFVISRDGTIRKVFENVKPQGHAEEVLAAVSA
jgi:peroxiredoxin Q/BCP